MWTLTVDGRTVRADDLTVNQAVEVERLAGASWVDISPWRSAKHARACATVALGVDLADRITLGNFAPTGEDLPVTFRDGVPDEGGRTFDGWLVVLVGLGFTPRQIREEFTLRDLALIAAAQA